MSPGADGRQRLLSSEADSLRMRAGLVILAPGESVGRHNTNDNEELIVVLEGEGLMVSDGGR